MKLRLDKYLADSGLGTRSEVRKEIYQGHVSVNGKVCTGISEKIDTEKDRVDYHGETVAYAPYCYLLMNKPSGVLSATEDKHCQTVLDLIDERYRHYDLFPVGRLDKDTEGFLLLTNDGALAHDLLSPKKHVEKEYLARLDRPVGEREQALFAEGITLEDGLKTLPAKLIIGLPCENDALVILTEGKFHQVKRMFLAVGAKVLKLKRTAFGGLRLPEELPPGTYRPLTAEELEVLKKR